MIIKSLKPNTDNYKLDEVNCFDKSIGIAIESFQKNLSNYFYMFLKFSQCYNINNKVDNRLVRGYELSYSLKICKEYLGINYRKNKVIDNLHQKIKACIDNNERVVVPGNLRELYYSPHYCINDWDHLFLIKGYNKKTKVYYILDSQHTQEEGKYTDFILQYDTLEKMFYSYFNLIEHKEYTYISFYKNEKFEFSNVSALIQLFNLLDKGLKDQKFKEIDYINYIQKNLVYNQDMKEIGVYTTDHFIYNLVNTTKFKKVFFEELIFNLNNILEEKDSITELKDLTDEIINSWRTVVNIIIVNIYRKKQSELGLKLDKTIKLEKKLSDKLKNINELLTNRKDKITRRTNKKIVIEEDDDNVITLDETGFKFNFRENKIYNCWISDNAPKLFFNTIDCKQFQFNIAISIQKHIESIDYMAGILLETKEHVRYFFGINCDYMLRLEVVGIIRSLLDIPLQYNKLIIKVSVEGTQCKFIYFDSKEQAEKIFQIVESESEIQRIGVMCKKWSEKGNLVIDFKYI